MIRYLKRKCPKCRGGKLRFVANDIAVGKVCDGCGHEEVIKWR